MSDAVVNFANVGGFVVVKMPKNCNISHILSDCARFNGFEGNCVTRGEEYSVYFQHANDSNGGKLYSRKCCA